MLIQLKYCWFSRFYRSSKTPWPSSGWGYRKQIYS